MDDKILKVQELMEKIVSVQHIDLKQQKIYCDELCLLADQYEDPYAKAFALTYLSDWATNSRTHKECYLHLQEAFLLCREHQFSDLLLKLYNIAGMYNASHFDEISAVQNYLDGLKIAIQLDAIETQMVLLNNIGTLFNDKEDIPDALEYIGQAYELFLKHHKKIQCHADLIIILNIIELYLKSNRIEDAEDVYLHYVPAIKENGKESDIPIIHIFELYLAFATNHIEESIKLADYFINSGLHLNENRNLYFSFYRDVFQIMLKMEDKARAETLLRCMGSLCLVDDIEQQLQLHLCWINFAETFHMEDTLIVSYKQYYQLQKQINDVTNKFKADSMKEKILVNTIRDEKECIIKEKQVLESRVKIDGLTKLFNRSYFAMLIENFKANPKIKTIGIIILDVDYFKQYNDFYGHYQGDQVLQTVAQCLDMNTDSSIFAARYGGDEFICACINMQDEEIEDYIKRVIHDLNTHHIEHKKSTALDIVSISAGYSNLANDKDFSLDVAVNVADSALYQVKSNGRNNFTKCF